MVDEARQHLEETGVRPKADKRLFPQGASEDTSEDKAQGIHISVIEHDTTEDTRSRTK